MNEDTNPVFDYDEHNAKLVKSLGGELEDKHVEAMALRDRAELWQRAAQDALDQVAALRVRCELAEGGRDEWRKTAGEWMRASQAPRPVEVALHQFAIYHLAPRRPVRLIQPHKITYPHRFEIPVGVVGYLNHEHGTEPIEDGGVVVEIPVAHVPGLELDGVRALYPRIPLGALGLHDDWSINPTSPAAPRGLPDDLAGELEAIRAAHGLDDLNGVLRVLLGRYEETEDSARFDGAYSGQDRWACLCGLASCGAPLNQDALCPACLELVTHRGEEGGEGAEWGRCVECKADRHVWRVHTAADPCGSLVCGHCMALDLAHKAAEEAATHLLAIVADEARALIHRLKLKHGLYLDTNPAQETSEDGDTKQEEDQQGDQEAS